MQNSRDEGSLTRPSPVKKLRKTFEEPKCSTLEPLVEYEELDFDPEQVFCFEDTYTEFAHTSDVCAGAERLFILFCHKSNCYFKWRNLKQGYMYM